MDKKHGIKSLLGCPKYKRTFSSIKFQVSHIKKCEELKPKATKEFGCEVSKKVHDTEGLGWTPVIPPGPC